MSNSQQGLDQFTARVLRAFHIDDPAQANPATLKFIGEKFRARFSVSATVRDLRAELHVQLVAQQVELERQAAEDHAHAEAVTPAITEALKPHDVVEAYANGIDAAVVEEIDSLVD
jgi:hypothetical protein